ncbi:hypothetical protein HAHI6034_06615 [Hathewaya histolytica]|uniref:DUF3021 domain-containing protein n=1 Tax=Hathewaya histolytica TaxID=1498 RepID=A0A4U9RW47_HATHI|nr:hypothetical protein [Hathewaya histolytica]VTQ96051.1 Uncharacterised protein [Hathewaya histolytica]
MIKQFKLSFFQTFSATFIWILLLMSLFLKDISITISYNWNLVGISTIFALIFGVMYPALWNFSSMKAIYKILISSTINLCGGLISVWLFSSVMFEIIRHWILIIAIVTIIGHIIAFYFYSKWDNERSSDKLNTLLKKSN